MPTLELVWNDPDRGTVLHIGRPMSETELRTTALDQLLDQTLTPMLAMVRRKVTQDATARTEQQAALVLRGRC